jgi:PAS domain S-box-containing protein
MERILQFIGHTADGVCAIDGDQRIVLWNAAAERMLGYSSEEVKGRFCYALFCGSDEDGCRLCTVRCAAVRAAERMQIVSTRDLRTRTKAGRDLWLSVSTMTVPVVWITSLTLVHLFRDATARKELEGMSSRGSERSTSGSFLERPSTPDPAAPRVDDLTERELEVLRLLATGNSTRAMATRLSISNATVRNHVHHVLEKLDAHSRLEAVARALRLRLL